MARHSRLPTYQYERHPEYNVSTPALVSWRRKSAAGLSTMEKNLVREYGEAVEKAVLAKQKSELQRLLPGHKSPCASGTWHSDGAEIHAAILQQQRAQLQAMVARERRVRTAARWVQMYEMAMHEKQRRACPIYDMALHFGEPFR